MASKHSRTVTVEQTRAKCHSIVLKLKSQPTNSREDEPQRMLNNLKERADNRFDLLMRKFVIDEKEQINGELLENLKKVKDPDTFLEAFLTHLYGKALKEEEAVVSPNVSEEDIHEIDEMVKHISENKKKETAV